ncbi:type VII secretion-associated serine protease mycosin [Corynebacterium sp. TAE3-ERU12]|uniref:type VII secretion-associated serine protease mycosin n=1 Tax=Corynebacterium sp. TAE3-ERU12 TaxID=2849491 RepID=UPI001C4653A7|nr:type VII secretion-associated serine protease mycosin [Corynebacterium sp. TAE3-ERU12]MBV7294687.1 type VII secretion-associated serine protease mycosin [Corynebacterium sp. TAE3-ERU12]
MTHAHRIAAVGCLCAVHALFVPAPGAWAQGHQCPDTALSTPAAAEADDPAALRLGWRSAWPLADGSGVTVAVIDTGVAPHPRLGQVIDGGDLISGGSAFADCAAHGTVVAGRIAARPGGDAIAGVAPGAEILAIRQTDGESGNLHTLAAAIDQAVAAGARVINMSVTACAQAGVRPDGADAVGRAAADAVAAGVVLVAAAGNAGAECTEDAVAWPAVVDGVIAVTAVATAEAAETAAEPWALRGSWVDLAAPGGPVVGLDPRGDGVVDTLVQGQSEQPIMGTSFAAPVVSGTAALVLSRYPHLGATQVRKALMDSASPIAGAENVGVGVVDPVAAVSWPQRSATFSASPVPTPAPTAAPDRGPVRRITVVAMVGVAALVIGVLVASGWRRHAPETEAASQ